MAGDFRVGIDVTEHLRTDHSEEPHAARRPLLHVHAPIRRAVALYTGLLPVARTLSWTATLHCCQWAFVPDWHIAFVPDWHIAFVRDWHIAFVQCHCTADRRVYVEERSTRGMRLFAVIGTEMFCDVDADSKIACHRPQLYRPYICHNYIGHI